MVQRKHTFYIEFRGTQPFSPRLGKNALSRSREHCCRMLAEMCIYPVVMFSLLIYFFVVCLVLFMLSFILLHSISKYSNVCYRRLTTFYLTIHPSFVYICFSVYQFLVPSSTISILQLL